MINGEKYKKELLKVINENVQGFIAFDIRDNKIKNCTTIKCENCKFSSIKTGVLCTQTKLKWLLSEYKEPVKLSRLEYEILKWEKKEGYKYIARTSSNSLFFYANKPNKLNYCWVSKDNNDEFFGMFNKLFQFVQWEDSEPTAIDDVLNNCEVIDDESSN